MALIALGVLERGALARGRAGVGSRSGRFWAAAKPSYFEGTFGSNRYGSMVEFMGTEATLYVDRGRYEVIPDRGKKKPEPSSLVLGSGEKGLDFYDKPDGELLHLTNWVECVRSRKKPTAPAEAGVSGASAAHLANLSLRSGQVAVWKG